MLAIAACVASTCALGQDQVREGATVTLNNDMPIERDGVTVDQNLGARIPLGLPLKDSLGRRTKAGYYIDGVKPTIITMNYSDCPMLCNVQLNQLTKALDQLDLKINEDFRILTVSIDPARGHVSSPRDKGSVHGHHEEPAWCRKRDGLSVLQTSRSSAS